MSLVRLAPAFKDYLWGGTKLKERYYKRTDLDIVAESWELSTHKDGQSTIDSGKYKGMRFDAYVKLMGKEVVGTNGATFESFPMLIKFIDAKKDLSIQVHPDNEYAQRVEKEYGKTEMWYIVEAEEGAHLYYGTNQELTKEEARMRIKNDTFLDVLNCVPVHKGDVFFIEAGTIHAIGAGIVICEIQQNSNSTYRVYDFGRVGKDGKPRELHIDKAMDVSNFKPLTSNFKPQGDWVTHEGYTCAMMGTCAYFTSYIYEVTRTCTFHVDEKSFASCIIIDGEGTIQSDDTLLSTQKGDSFFVDANTGNITIQGKCRFILSNV